MSDDRESLNTLARVRREDERRAGEVLRQAQVALETEEQRLESVQSYLDEYHSLTVTGLRDPRRLREQRLFLSQLERTVQAQEWQVQRARQAVESARAQWIAVRVQREALDRLLERRAQARTHGELRAEQRQQDELSLRGAVARPLSTGTFGG